MEQPAVRRQTWRQSRPAFKAMGELNQLAVDRVQCLRVGYLSRLPSFFQMLARCDRTNISNRQRCLKVWKLLGIDTGV